MSFSRRYDPGEYRPQFGGFSFFPLVIKNIIIINVVMFIIQQLVNSGFTLGGIPLNQWFIRTFYLWPVGEGFLPWQLISYMFLHGDLWHIFLNMLMLWMFGMEVENTWGSGRFLVFYFVCGIMAGLSNLFVAPLFTEAGPTIGASGSVYGVLVAFAMLFPNRYVYIYFLIPVKAKYLISFFILLELYNGVMAEMGGIAHMAHLGGALMGAIWVLLDYNGVIDKLFSKIKSGGNPRVKQNSTWSSGPDDARFYEIPKRETPPADTPESSNYQKVIDEILDKISKHGYGGLTEQEKRILLDASRKMNPDKH